MSFTTPSTLSFEVSDWMMDPLASPVRPSIAIPGVSTSSGVRNSIPVDLITTPTLTLVDSDSGHQNDDAAPASSDPTKPPYDYKTLVAMALESGGSGGMTICGIYAYVQQNFAYYRSEHAPSTWRSRIRNVLTVNDCFKRIPDPKGGRKGKWVLQRPEGSTDAGLKSPHTIRMDKSPKAMRRSASTLVLTPTDISHSDSEPQSAISVNDLEFSFDDEDVRNIDKRITTRATYFAPQPLTNLTAPSVHLSLYNPSLALSAVDVVGARTLSAASMEMVDQLAIELKQECSMLSKQRANSRNVAPIA